MGYRRFVIFFVMFFIPLYSVEKLEIRELSTNKERVEKLLNHAVQVRGFLYISEKGELVLAGEPSLKSCCIGSKTKKAQQFFVDGNITPPTQPGMVVLLEGVFGQDQHKRFWLLEAYAVEQSTDWKSVLLFLGIATICFFLIKKFIPFS